MTLGDIRDGVDVNPSGDQQIADIKGRVADLFDAMDGEDPPSEIARSKALTATDFEAVALRTAKAAAQSGRHVKQPMTCRLVAPAPHATAPDATSRCRRPAGRQVASTRPCPRRPRRPYAAPLRARTSALRHPVLTPLCHAALSHQTWLHPSSPEFAHSDPLGTPCTERLDGSPRARNRARRRRKCPSRAPRRIHRHDSAPRARHAPGAQRALQHRRFGYNILWLCSSIIAREG